jgi:hypothetical protein
MYQFNSEGNLKSFAINRDRLLKNIMMRRGILVSDDTLYQMPIQVTGVAKSFIKTKVLDTIKIDSTSIEEFDF